MSKFKVMSGVLLGLTVGGFVILGAGCGPEPISQVQPATSNAPPGGADPSEYARKMAELQGRPGAGGRPGSGGSGPAGGPPGPGGGPPMPGNPR